MLFNAPIFLFGFFPITAILCFLIRAWVGREAALAFLVLASLFFYGWWNPVYLPLLIGLAVFDAGGAELGTVRAVLDHGAGDILEIARPGAAELLLPFTRAVVMYSCPSWSSMKLRVIRVI